MLFLHEVHEVVGGREQEFAACYRDDWLPLLARGDDARLLWYFEHAHVSSRAHNVITVTAIKDAAALGRLCSALDAGSMREWQRRVDGLRSQASSRILLPTRWSRMQEVDYATVPTAPDARHEPTVYCEDTVWPPVLDDYIAMCGEMWFRPTTDGTARVRCRIEMPAFFQVAHGTGQRPEVYLVQKLVDPAEVFVRNLLGTDYPPEMKQPDHYFVKGLAVRDQWESKILRTVEWSPLD